MKGITGRKVIVRMGYIVENKEVTLEGIFLDWGVYDGETVGIIEKQNGQLLHGALDRIQFIETAKFWEGVI